MHAGPRFAVALICTLSCGLASPVAGDNIGRIQKVFVAVTPDTPYNRALRGDIIASLKKRTGIKIVEHRDEADAVLQAKAEIWTQGYLSLNPRMRTVTAAQPIRRGYLSVELERNDETVWSYLVNARLAGPEDIRKDLADQMARKLAAAIARSRP
jgi:hypothetical protein